MVNFYELLGINDNATNEEINKAYREKAKIYHPDKNNGSEAADSMFKMIGLAKETLLDAKKRLNHDYAVGVKKQPVELPKIVRFPAKSAPATDNTGMMIGLGLLAFIAGLALGNSRD